MHELTLYHYLGLSAILFALGVAGVLLRRNAIGLLISIELIINAACLNFVSFSRYTEHSAQSIGLGGQVFALFIMLLAACEAAIALAIIISLYNTFGSVDVNRADTMSG